MFFTEAEEGLRQIKRNHVAEFLPLRNPPPCALQIFKGLLILLNPSESMSHWIDIRQWLAENIHQLVTITLNYNKTQMTKEQLFCVNEILTRDDCQPERTRKCSHSVYALCMWLRAVVQYGTFQCEAT